MKITVLCENTSCREGIAFEHGLSLFIETKEKNILFDMGASELFARNAQKLGVDISSADIAVISHGHYDHGGGLCEFLKINEKAPVYVNRRAFGEHYNASFKNIGLDPSLSESERIVFVDEVLEIGDGITLFSCNERERTYKTDPAGQKCVKNGVLCCEDFLHEQYLLVKEDGKRVLFSGCSHKGILNICKWFAPDVLVGGFHFMKLDTSGEGGAVLEHAARELLSYPTKYYTAHCTGETQFAFLKERMGTRLEYVCAGDSIDV